MLVYCAHSMTAQEPAWIQPVAEKLATLRHATWRPNASLKALLDDPGVRAHLDRAPRLAFVRLARELGLDDRTFGPPTDKNVLAWLYDLDGGVPLIAHHARDLYGLVRSDVVVVDLSDPAPEIGVDLLFARTGGAKIVGLTDRFAHAPSVLARLDVMMVPNDVDGIVDVVTAFARERPAGQVSVLDRVNAVIARAENHEEAAKHSIPGT